MKGHLAQALNSDWKFWAVIMALLGLLLLNAFLAPRPPAAQARRPAFRITAPTPLPLPDAFP